MVLPRNVDRAVATVLDREGLGVTVFEGSASWSHDPAAADTHLDVGCVGPVIGQRVEPASGVLDIPVSSCSSFLVAFFLAAIQALAQPPEHKADDSRCANWDQVT